VNNLQLNIAIGLPTVAVLASLTVTRVPPGIYRRGGLIQISGIREDIGEIRNDIKLLTGKVAEVDTRLSLIERAD
jgi:hypothetical protein